MVKTDFQRIFNKNLTSYTVKWGTESHQVTVIHTYRIKSYQEIHDIYKKQLDEIADISESFNINLEFQVELIKRTLSDDFDASTSESDKEDPGYRLIRNEFTKYAFGQEFKPIFERNITSNRP